MKGDHAFCPKTGAELSRTIHYDDDGRPWRAAVADEHTLRRKIEGELTAGAIRSSASAVLAHFRRCYERRGGPGEDPYGAAGVALRRLKRTARGTEQWDAHVWYALRCRLEDRGYDVDWMDAHADPRCPSCGSHLVYREVDGGDVRGLCPTNCTGDGRNRLPEIRRTIATLYRRAFGEETDSEAILRFR